MSKGSTWSGVDFAALAGCPVLVTGGAGFIGSHLATALSAIGAKVTVLDDLSAGGDPKALPSDVEFVKDPSWIRPSWKNAPLVAGLFFIRRPWDRCRGAWSNRACSMR